MPRPLDPIDYNLIEVLQRNARVTNKELAARVHLSPSRCFERARRLKEQGVLTGFNASVSPPSIGVGLQALVEIELTEHTPGSLEAFADQAAEIPEVVGILHVTGKMDFFLELAVRDPSHLRLVTTEKIAILPTVAALQTHLILSETRRPLPILARFAASA